MIGLRLKEERERLAMTQAEFAVAAHAGKRTLSDWEKGTTYPTAAQLAALYTIGVDVMYIITGTRSIAAATADEQLLLEGYRKLPPDFKNRMLSFMLVGESSEPQKKKKKPKKQIQIAENIAGRDLIQAGIVKKRN